jgi:hypothetical protein
LLAAQEDNKNAITATAKKKIKSFFITIFYPGELILAIKGGIGKIGLSKGKTKIIPNYYFS